jgi:hypothetical protein
MTRSLLVVLFAVLALPLLPACETAEEPEEEVSTPPQADLSALERRRSGSDGAAIEQAAADARSAGAHKVYASADDEPGLIEFTAEGELPPGMDADVSGAGESVPSDLDRANEEIGPWIDMNLVGQTVRSSNRSLKSCYDDASAGKPNLGRRVDIRLTVDGRGKASGIKIARSSPTNDSGLERCIAGVLGKAKFPEAQNGDKTFTYSLSF